LPRALKIFKRRRRQRLKVSQKMLFCLVLTIIFLSAVGDSGKNFSHRFNYAIEPLCENLMVKKHKIGNLGRV
jgi:hypothetical protein